MWCQTCRHEHVAYIPATTFMCAACGFGSWGEDVAESHATDLPTHIVYPVVHEVVALDEEEL